MEEDYKVKLKEQKVLFNQLGIKLDALTIHEKDFSVKMRGYDKEEVDRFLDEIIEDYEHFYTVITDLLNSYKDLQRRNSWAEERNAKLERDAAMIEKAKLNADQMVDRRVVEEAVKQVERSLDQLKIRIAAGPDYY
ncbi:DivIVA domain-containing protein [Paenibacillus sediminis]|uniref:DivIVA domain-containing protein n=1 Tax=Paenibacillus sediminis TaxID=664909 RepID=A0ABS4H478_9BACL|nr:DivIVA domain-containing protein [Paenibacillus sediminis]MBP1937353.1 DivIVA domain-containing protein [Paenibacillus sediminis]